MQPSFDLVVKPSELVAFLQREKCEAVNVALSSVQAVILGRNAIAVESRKYERAAKPAELTVAFNPSCVATRAKNTRRKQ